MKDDGFFKAFNEIDNKLIGRADHCIEAKVKHFNRNWIKWGSFVACLSFVIVGGFVVRGLWGGSQGNGVQSESEKMEVNGGVKDNYLIGLEDALPDGEMKYGALLGALPDGVKDSSMITYTKETMYSNEQFGAYLPSYIPEGFNLDAAVLYLTKLDDGTMRNRMNVSFSDEFGNTLVFEPMTYESYKSYKSYNNDINKPVIAFSEFTTEWIQRSLDMDKWLSINSGYEFYVKYENVYVRFFSGDTNLSADEIYHMYSSFSK